MEGARIVLMFVAAGVVYGLIHDQITARVCLEYFTVGHVRMFASDSPTLHALYWGIAATWWAGLAVGLLIAAASRCGRLPKLTASQQRKPALILMALMGIFAALAGALMHSWVGAGGYVNGPLFVDDVQIQDKAAFLADAAAHDVSYLVGFAGGVAVALISIARRIRAQQTTSAAT